jgi:hypothetical protein
MVVILYREAIEYFSNALPSSGLDLSLLFGIAGATLAFLAGREWLRGNVS